MLPKSSLHLSQRAVSSFPSSIEVPLGRACSAICVKSAVKSGSRSGFVQDRGRTLNESNPNSCRTHYLGGVCGGSCLLASLFVGLAHGCVRW